MAAQITAKVQAALAKVAAATGSNGNGRQYEVEAPLNEAGITIHFERGEVSPNQGRFYFKIDGVDPGAELVSYTTRKGAREAAALFLAEMAGDES